MSDQVSVIDRPELARLEHENLIAALAIVAANHPGSLIRRSGGVALIATGLPLRIFNQIIVERGDATETAIVDAIEATRRRGDRFVVNLRVESDDRFIGLMKSSGLVPLSSTPWLPGMAAYPIATGAATTTPGHEIRQVTDTAGVEDHIQTAIPAFGLAESVVRSMVGPALANAPGSALYVGYTDGLPVSTGLGIRTGRTIGVYNISTLESARRQGLGAAMTARVAADGAAAGCDVAILQASEMGFPIYERLGYRTVVEYMGYVDPASMDQPADRAGQAGRSRSGGPT